MQRVPMAEFEPKLRRRLEELWGKPVNLYRALGNQPRKAGVSEERIAALAGWRASRHFDEKERAALALTEAVMACNVTDEVYAEVKRHFGAADYVELCLSAAAYAMVSRMLDALRVELDDNVRGYAPELP